MIPKELRGLLRRISHVALSVCMQHLARSLNVGDSPFTLAAKELYYPGGRLRNEAVQWPSLAGCRLTGPAAKPFPKLASAEHIATLCA